MVYTGIVCQILIAWIYGHFLEYCAHRFYLHGRYRAAKPAFSSHFKDHHSSSRKNRMKDPKYQVLHFDPRSDFEQRSLFYLTLAHFPLIFFFPYAYITLVYSAISYYVIHNLVHRFPLFGRRFFPWHYEHHLATDQHKNWGVRLPLFDYVFNTRVIYIGTDKETRDIFRYIAKQREESEVRPHSDSSKRP